MDGAGTRPEKVKSLDDFARAMREIGYRGSIAYELCHQLPRENGETVGIEFAHKNAQLAAEFMRQIVREAYESEPGQLKDPQTAVTVK